MNDTCPNCKDYAHHNVELEEEIKRLKKLIDDKMLEEMAYQLHNVISAHEDGMEVNWNIVREVLDKYSELVGEMKRLTPESGGETKVNDCKDPYHNGSSLFWLLYDQCPSCNEVNPEPDQEKDAPLNCPHCTVSLLGQRIPIKYRASFYGNYFKREIGVEYPEVYDGVHHYECPDCHGTWGGYAALKANPKI